MSNALCCEPAPSTEWATVASLLHSEPFLSAIRQAREAASPFGDCGDDDDDDSCVPCIDICPAVDELRADLDRMIQWQDENENKLDFYHALTQRLADERDHLQAEFKEAKRILAIRERQLDALLAITPGPDTEGAGPRFII